jgi:ubiquinone/menaquinone biosynthesis C-methylase UbiE
MASESELPIEERILQVLKSLGITKAHFAGLGATDWTGLVANHAESVASLTLVCPVGATPDIISPISSRLLVFAADQGPGTQTLRSTVEGFSDARLSILQDYVSLLWADVVADRTDELQSTMLDFLDGIGRNEAVDPITLLGAEGEISGISYRVLGSGPPLVLLPLGLAPSQWGPLLPCLSQKYFTIIMGGPSLGWTSILESRGISGFLTGIRNLIDEIDVQPGESILEVGCGSGVGSRCLARRTSRANHITAVDLSPYLLGEAEALARREGIGDFIEFREGNAEALDFPDDSFDVTFSVTVMEEVNAARMFGELVRVTKPGGRVAVIVRAEDRPLQVNLTLRPELKAKAEAPGGARPGSVEGGCADASLYQMFSNAGLIHLKMFPHLAASAQTSWRETLSGHILPSLTSMEIQEWQTAVEQAGDTFFIATPLHCAVGTIPG